MSNVKGIRKRGTDSQGRGVWEVNVQYTNTDSGRTERVFRTVHGTQRDAVKERGRVLEELERGLRVTDASKITLREYAEGWLRDLESLGSVRKSTIRNYGSSIRTLCAYLGDMKLRGIKPMHIRQAYADMREERGLKNSTVMRHHVCLKQILKAAVNDDLLSQNPLDRVDAPRCEKAERRSLSRFDAGRLVAALDRAEECAVSRLRDGDTHALLEVGRLAAARLGLATGARRGEVLALTWDDVSLDSGEVSISKSISPLMEVTPPKSASGIRDVSIDSKTLAALDRLRGCQSEYLRGIGCVLSGSTPVVMGATGRYQNVKWFSDWWRRWSSKNGFDGLLFHELRHTQATMLLANKVDVKTVQTRLGHSDASITLNTYAHAVRENDRNAADLMGRLLDSEEQGAEVISYRKRA